MFRVHVVDLLKADPALGAVASRPDRPARLGLAVAVAACASLVATLSIRGVSCVNLDSLLEDPATFYALLVAPGLLALGGLVIALPRIVSGNVAVFVGLLLLAEVAAWSLAPAPTAIHGEPEAIGGGSFYVRDPALGYVLAPSVTARHRRTEGERVVYDVIYGIDDRGRRQTPTTGDERRESFLLFFGDSNTFGEGLGPTETLPSQAGQHAPRYRPYNYGVPGYGPAQLLAQVEKGRIADEVTEREGYAVYLLIPAHVARVVGSTQVSTGWGRHFSYYTLGEGGELRSNGDFVHARPLTTLGYYFWTKSSLAAYFGVDLPLRYTAEDYRLSAKILVESSRMLARQIRLRGFVVVLGQVFNPAQRRVINGTRDALVAEGIAVLDYTALFDANERRYRLSELDYHNSAEANRVLAARLASDLRIGR